jgi:hypothetical protein
MRNPPVGSGSTIAVGGTAQQVAPASQLRNGFQFFNTSANAMKINEINGTAANDNVSILVPANSSYTTPAGVSPIFAVSVWCATATSTYTWREW